MNEIFGTFRGTVLRQSEGKVGGARSVFAKFKGLKNELVYPFAGGLIKNAPKGEGFKFFAGDLMEFRTNERYEKPEVYLLKTYKVKSVNSTKVTIERDGYKHKPFANDILGVAPEKIGGEMTAATVKSVVEVDGGWELTMSAALSGAKEGDVLVEGVANGSTTMLVKAINAFADCDGDMPYVGATEALTDFEKAKYLYTPAVGGAYIYIHKMSPLPACVLAENKSQFNGLFKTTSLN